MALTPTSADNDHPLPFDADKFDQKRKWHRFSKWLGRDEQSPCPDGKQEADSHRPSFGRRLSRKVATGLPRSATLKRQNSEKRERLTPVDPAYMERRTLSVDRKRVQVARAASPAPVALPKLSAPAAYGVDTIRGFTELSPSGRFDAAQSEPRPPERLPSNELQVQRPAPPPSPPPDRALSPPGSPPGGPMDDDIRMELEERWILNLSMHFRDRSPRERFFITYAETPTKWRRITITIDYRDAPPDSLERDLQSLGYQRDKSARIYESIRTSLQDIQFYDTVTNLRLQTSDDDRLHVHVTEDVNEIIPYPSVNLVDHIGSRRVPERDVHFESHMSGFVYKVRVGGKIYIKKEIPGPDSVEEFLYEINALYSLLGSRNVIRFEGLVVDEKEGLVKGLLIGYAEQGPLVDMIYDFKGHLSWDRRQKWAKQIVAGLSEIHEAGFVQGDFTLSNIVVDEYDTAKIIDINRRGCPVGWEPPEIAKMIESGQRISMYIGVKSDLFQLGMVLWALAEEEDEPERQERPLSLKDTLQAIPEYFRELTSTCLLTQPRERISAKEILQRFPELDASTLEAAPLRSSVPNTDRSLALSTPPETQYIDPSHDVRREDIDLLSDPVLASGRGRSRSPRFSDSHTYIERPSSVDMPFDDHGSYIVNRRGRTPAFNTAHLDSPSSHEPYMHGATDNDIDTDRVYDSDSEALSPLSHTPTLEPQVIPISPMNTNDPLASHDPNVHKWERVEVDGRSFLVDLEDETPEERRQRLARSTFRRGGNHRGVLAELNDNLVRAMEHVDSGLADMDGIDLAGVGENEALVGLSCIGDEGRRGRGFGVDGMGRATSFDDDIDHVERTARIGEDAKATPGGTNEHTPKATVEEAGTSNGGHSTPSGKNDESRNLRALMGHDKDIVRKGKTGTSDDKSSGNTPTSNNDTFEQHSDNAPVPQPG